MLLTTKNTRSTILILFNHKGRVSTVIKVFASLAMSPLKCEKLSVMNEERIQKNKPPVGIFATI